MLRRTMLKGVAAIAAAGVFSRHAGAQEVLKMGNQYSDDRGRL